MNTVTNCTRVSDSTGSKETNHRILKNYFVVVINQMNIGFPINSVFGVYPMPKLYTIPNLPKPVLGISIISQQPLPIVEILCSEWKTQNSKNLAIILENGYDKFGLRIDKVKGIFSVPVSAIKELKDNQLAPKPFADYVKEVWDNAGELFWILEPKKMIWYQP